MNPKTKSGYVSIVGKTNAGKSTLLNNILGQKIAITSRKPQTTRHRFLGIRTDNENQIIFVDTPGFHSGQKRALNRYMNKVASNAMRGVDIVLYVLDKLNWSEDDLSRVQSISKETLRKKKQQILRAECAPEKWKQMMKVSLVSKLGRPRK